MFFKNIKELSKEESIEEDTILGEVLAIISKEL